jgi:hypothetical protein
MDQTDKMEAEKSQAKFASNETELSHRSGSEASLRLRIY